MPWSYLKRPYFFHDLKTFNELDQMYWLFCIEIFVSRSLEERNSLLDLGELVLRGKSAETIGLTVFWGLPFCRSVRRGGLHPHVDWEIIFRSFNSYFSNSPILTPCYSLYPFWHTPLFLRSRPSQRTGEALHRYRDLWNKHISAPPEKHKPPQKQSIRRAIARTNQAIRHLMKPISFLLEEAYAQNLISSLDQFTEQHRNSHRCREYLLQ